MARKRRRNSTGGHTCFPLLQLPAPLLVEVLAFCSGGTLGLLECTNQHLSTPCAADGEGASGAAAAGAAGGAAVGVLRLPLPTWAAKCACDRRGWVPLVSRALKGLLNWKVQLHCAAAPWPDQLVPSLTWPFAPRHATAAARRRGAALPRSAHRLQAEQKVLVADTAGARRLCRARGWTRQYFELSLGGERVVRTRVGPSAAEMAALCGERASAGGGALPCNVVPMAVHARDQRLLAAALAAGADPNRTEFAVEEINETFVPPWDGSGALPPLFRALYQQPPNLDAITLLLQHGASLFPDSLPGFETGALMFALNPCHRALPTVITRRPQHMRALMLRSLLQGGGRQLQGPRAASERARAFFFVVIHQEEACLAELIRGRLEVPAMYVRTCVRAFECSECSGVMLGAPPRPAQRGAAAASREQAVQRAQLLRMLEAAELDAEMAAVQTAALRGQARKRPAGGWGAQSSGKLNLTLLTGMAGAAGSDANNGDISDDSDDETTFDCTAWMKPDNSAEDYAAMTHLWMVRVIAAVAIADGGGHAWAVLLRIFDQIEPHALGEADLQPNAAAFRELHSIVTAEPVLMRLCAAQCAELLQAAEVRLDGKLDIKPACLLLLLLHSFIDIGPDKDGGSHRTSLFEHHAKCRHDLEMLNALDDCTILTEACMMWRRNAGDLRDALRNPQLPSTFLGVVCC